MTYIRVIEDEYLEGTRQARSDWATVTGKTLELKPAIFVDTRTGWRYCHITGAIAYPGLQPGCIIIIGIQHEPVTRFVVLEYREHQSVFDLITDAVTLRGRYGYGEHEGILASWIGDPERYLSITSRVSQELEARGGYDRGFYVREPIDWTEKHAFPMYIRQIHAALADKMLMLNGHMELINRLQAFQTEDADKGKLTDFPTVGILGAMTHTLITERPWETDTDHGEPIMTDI